MDTSGLVAGGVLLTTMAYICFGGRPKARKILKVILIMLIIPAMILAIINESAGNA